MVADAAQHCLCIRSGHSQGSDDDAQAEGGSIREKLVARTGPCVRLSPDLLQFMARLKRLFFLSEGQDLSR